MDAFRWYLTEQSNLWLGAAVAVMTLTLFTLGYIFLSWYRPSEHLPKISRRIQFLWILTCVFLVSMRLSYKILLVYIAFISFLALKEFLSITPTRRSDRRVLFCAYLAIPLQFFIIWMGWREAFILFVPAYVFLLLPIIMIMMGETHGFLKAWSMLGWGILTTVCSLGYLAYLLVLPVERYPVAGGGGLFLFLVGLAQIAHAAQYYFGKRFPHPRLSLRVSKTRNWASLIGSTLVCIPLAWVGGPFLTPFSAPLSALIGALIAVGSFIGYIILSAIKGDLQLTDRGSMTPGRGGVLNRIDAFVYTAPLYFYIVASLYY